MSLKTATLLALLGVAFNFLIGLGLNLSRLAQGSLPPTQLLPPFLGFLMLNGGLLVFFVVLYRKQ